MAPAEIDRILTAYLRMAHGFGGSFTPQDAERANADDPAYRDYALSERTRRMIESRGSTPFDYRRSLAFEKPSYVENLLYCAELRERFGDLSGVPGFDAEGNLQLPKWDGFILPISTNGLLSELRFYSQGELKERQRRAA